MQKPSLAYLRILTTNDGIMQHTRGTTPDPRHGYAVDDNARALLAVYLWRLTEDPSFGQDLEKIYITNLEKSQAPNGEFYCYLSVDLEGINLGYKDWFGRSLMSLAFGQTQLPKLQNKLSLMLDKSLPLVFSKDFSLHTMSFLLVAMYYQMGTGPVAAFPPVGARKSGDPFYPQLLRASGIPSCAPPAISRVNREFLAGPARLWAEIFDNALKKHSTKNWLWPEKAIRYDNGKLIQAYFLLGVLLESEKYMQIGKKLLDFYLEITMKKGYFQIPGNNGFWTEDKRPLWDEQALEVYSLIAALTSAFLCTKIPSYQKIAADVYQWFWGKNRLGTSMIDPASGGVFDGLGETAVNVNKGAESYLSLLLSYCLLKNPLLL